LNFWVFEEIFLPLFAEKILAKSRRCHEDKLGYRLLMAQLVPQIRLAASTEARIQPFSF